MREWCSKSAALTLAIACLAVAAGGVQARAPCDDDKGVWADSRDGRRTIFYTSDPPPQIGGAFRAVHIEEWRSGKLAWRQNGLLTCSNGASTCYVFMEVVGEIDDSSADGSPLNGKGIPEVDAVIETIDTDDDGLSNWVVLAGLRQKTWYSGGARVEWFNGFEPSDSDRIVPPNVYGFYACQRR